MTADRELKHLIGSTGILVLMLAIICPVFYRFVDLPAAEYARVGIPRNVVDAINQTSNLDDYINIVCIGLGLYALLRLKNKGRFQKAIYPPLSALFAGILTHLLKWPVSRWRPKAWFNHGMYGFEPFGAIKAGLTKHFGVHTAFCDTFPFAKSGILISFPSGHTSSMMGIMTAIAVLQPKYRYLCLTVAVFFGAFRVVEGAHYPSDVLAGLVVGYLAAHWLRYYLVQKNWMPREL